MPIFEAIFDSQMKVSLEKSLRRVWMKGTVFGQSEGMVASEDQKGNRRGARHLLKGAVLFV